MPPDSLTSPPAGPIGRPEGDLLHRLSSLRTAAERLAGQVLRPRGDLLRGTVETFTLDETGCVWIVGRMVRPPTVALSAVVVDGVRATAGLVMTLFDREDLPPGTCGFIGALYGAWTPSGVSDPLIHLDVEGGGYLDAAKPLRITEKARFAEFVDGVGPRCHTGPTAALVRLLLDPDPWRPTGEAVGFPLDVGIERLLVVPGFGALATGHVLSPLKRVVSLGLKVGPVVLEADPASLSRRPRPDLAGRFAAGASAAMRSGFAVLFRGAITDADHAGVVLKVAYSDGTASVHAVDPAALALLDASAVEAAAEVFPSLAQEGFFPDLAIALRSGAPALLGSVRSHSVHLSRRVLVCALPPDRPDIHLLFAEVSRRLSAGAERMPGLVLIAAADDTRAEAVRLFDGLRRLHPGACSLFFVDDPALALHALPAILPQLRAERFAFVGAGLTLTDWGFDALLDALDGDEPDPVVVESVDPAGEGAAGALAFAWSTEAALPWIGAALPRLGGAGAAELFERPRTISAGAFVTRSAEPSALVAALNAVQP